MNRPITTTDRVQVLYEGAFFISEKTEQIHHIDSIMSNKDMSEEKKEQALKAFLHESTKNNPTNRILLDCFFSSCENYYPDHNFY